MHNLVVLALVAGKDQKCKVRVHECTRKSGREKEIELIQLDYVYIYKTK